MRKYIINPIMCFIWDYKWVILTGYLLYVYSSEIIPESLPMTGDGIVTEIIRWSHVVVPVSAGVYTVKSQVSMLRKVAIFGAIAFVIHFFALQILI